MLICLVWLTVSVSRCRLWQVYTLVKDSAVLQGWKIWFLTNVYHTESAAINQLLKFKKDFHFLLEKQNDMEIHHRPCSNPTGCFLRFCKLFYFFLMEHNNLTDVRKGPDYLQSSQSHSQPHLLMNVDKTTLVTEKERNIQHRKTVRKV